MNFFLLLFALFILNNISKSQNIKEIVQINHNATWYEGKILKFENGSFYVSYYVWSHSWNEWGNKDKLKGFITNFYLQNLKEEIRLKLSME
ncbi:MAG: hypothetical protein UZ11_BCD004001754 [Bacteroidetes bacterium OLB11]|nr:MAG: hypothetical protein UZ11_BCD004001754 [Bacteroidetes bacterium OLB11]